ncbi:MAG: primosomal protein N' [Chloroflexi bacterium]|nr:primosomal protein N' [Chloroflexota bacterium]
MRYAEVAVDAPVTHTRTFSYSIPSHFSVEPGQLVWVPFGRRLAQGIVVHLADTPQVEVTRDIFQPVDPSPLLSTVHMDLAGWISDYYLCSLFAALALFLPPGFESQVRSQVFPVTSGVTDGSEWRPETREALSALVAASSLKEADFVKLLGRGGQRELAKLLDKRLVHRTADLPPPRIIPRHDCYLFAVGADGAGAKWPEYPARLPPRQERLLDAVRSAGESYPASLANKEFGHGVANALVEKGLLGLEWVKVEPSEAMGAGDKAAGSNLTLTEMQADALARITEALERPGNAPRSFLLHGVTGSGKTEVYLQAIQRVVAQGQQAIFLVPEIALTPQTLERLSARFPGRVAVLHSRLSQRQKFDQWWGIREGDYDVVVGPRSSLFAPLPDLGLIVVDEEHEWTYKQVEAQPLYHARRVALELARRTGAVVVMGSATPDVETYYHAQAGRHRLLELPHRIGVEPGGAGSELAQVEICDMALELQQGNRSIFSRGLAESLRDCVGRGRQAILFLNRRGSAPIVQCRDCGYVVSCRSCSVALAYHSVDGRLLCHRCNRRSRLPGRCRECGGSHIRQLGIGTQKVVEEVSRLLPGVRVERWDSDATRAGAGPGDAMQRLASGDIQVLVGTQVVAKGLDVANVTVVGVILADIGLNLPDFRAAERTFGLLCQVAGRAGRGKAPGRVFIQTYTPDHFAIMAAAAQDYSAMYQEELRFRRLMGNPPFNDLVHLVYQDINATICQRRAVATARQLRQKAYAQGLTNVEVIGPAPGIPARIRGRYRWHTILRGRSLHRFLEGFSFPPGTTVDVDPVHVL